jgi:hypothetical protein
MLCVNLCSACIAWAWLLLSRAPAGGLATSRHACGIAGSIILKDMMTRRSFTWTPRRGYSAHLCCKVLPDIS